MNRQLISPPSFKDIDNKEGKKMWLQMSQISPQILCLQGSVLIIQVLYTRAQRKKKNCIQKYLRLQSLI